MPRPVRIPVSFELDWIKRVALIRQQADVMPHGPERAALARYADKLDRAIEMRDLLSQPYVVGGADVQRRLATGIKPT